VTEESTYKVVPRGTVIYVANLERGIEMCLATGCIYAIPWVGIQGKSGAFTLGYNCSYLLNEAIQLGNARRHDRITFLLEQLTLLNKLVFDDHLIKWGKGEPELGDANG